MKKLHSFALYALVTPMITFGAGSVLAQQSSDKDMDSKQHNSQRDYDSKRSGAVSTQEAQGTKRSEKSYSKTGEDRGNKYGQSREENRGYMASTPSKGMHASNLMGNAVKTTDDKEVGSVSDLIIDEDGQIVAIVVGVGGILGMGEKDIAIGWDDVKRSGTSRMSDDSSASDDSDELELRIDATREDLRDAPEFESQE